MNSFFSSEFFKQNRQRLLASRINQAPIVITANGRLQRSKDNAYQFCQDANFWYLCGCEDADLILVIDDDEDYLIIPSQSDVQTIFDGALDEGEILRHSGVNKVYDDREGWRCLRARLNQTKVVYTLQAPPAYIKIYGMYMNPARSHLVRRLKRLTPGLELKDMTLELARARMYKQPAELTAIKAAIAITIDGLQGVIQGVKQSRYSSEFELEAELTHTFRRQGASGHGFDPIVASGQRACTIHNVANNGTLSPNQLIVLDVGAEVEHYSADITRTIAYGSPTPRQRQVYEAVQEVQRFGFDLLRPGVIVKDYEAKIEQRMGEALRSLGLIQEITRPAIRRYYPHATSHLLGLNVHDAGDYSQPLAAGMVLTVEPGIYIPEEAIGVRIEDDVLIQADGIEILTNQLPRIL